MGMRLLKATRRGHKCLTSFFAFDYYSAFRACFSNLPHQLLVRALAQVTANLCVFPELRALGVRQLQRLPKVGLEGRLRLGKLGLLIGNHRLQLIDVLLILHQIDVDLQNLPRRVNVVLDRFVAARSLLQVAQRVVQDA